MKQNEIFLNRTESKRVFTLNVYSLLEISINEIKDIYFFGTVALYIDIKNQRYYFSAIYPKFDILII